MLKSIAFSNFLIINSMTSSYFNLLLVESHQAKRWSWIKIMWIWLPTLISFMKNKLI